ncbi:hypothetical protein [Candidatus Lokiarchaeum ossiferum]|uniref:hypothetical protein n=1 Tax=Candidatus Lokiarchaeum ossiferum TaxID=2951803 RepID=UPI00352CA346
MSQPVKNSKKESLKLKSSILGPFLMGSIILVALVLILCNELFWVEQANADIRQLPLELWFVLSPGIVMMGILFILALTRLKSTHKSESSIKIDSL